MFAGRTNTPTTEAAQKWADANRQVERANLKLSLLQFCQSQVRRLDGDVERISNLPPGSARRIEDLFAVVKAQAPAPMTSDKLPRDSGPAPGPPRPSYSAAQYLEEEFHLLFHRAVSQRQSIESQLEGIRSQVESLKSSVFLGANALAIPAGVTPAGGAPPPGMPLPGPGTPSPQSDEAAAGAFRQALPNTAQLLTALQRGAPPALVAPLVAEAEKEITGLTKAYADALPKELLRAQATTVRLLVNTTVEETKKEIQDKQETIQTEYTALKEADLDLSQSEINKRLVWAVIAMVVIIGGVFFLLSYRKDEIVALMIRERVLIEVLSMGFLLLTVIILATGRLLDKQALAALLGTIGGYIFGQKAGMVLGQLTSRPDSSPPGPGPGGGPTQGQPGPGQPGPGPPALPPQGPAPAGPGAEVLPVPVPPAPGRPGQPGPPNPGPAAQPGPPVPVPPVEGPKGQAPPRGNGGSPGRK
jgi:hypothetical protein